MSLGTKRTIGGTLGFAFAAMWVAAGLGSAVECLAAAAVGYGAIRLLERGSIGAIVVAQGTLRRELKARIAPAARQVQASAKPRPRARREVREHVPKVMAVDPVTYGW